MARRKKPGPKTPWQCRTRYNRSRCARRLKPSQIDNLTAANVFAGRLKTPLNGFLTIKFSECGHPLREFQAATKRLSQWHRRWGGELRWVYVWEAIGGFHLHALIHIPRNSRQLLIEAIACAFAGHDFTLKSRYPGPSMMAYLCKGTDWVTHRQLARQSHIHLKSQGIVSWKRCGCTENLGRAARVKAKNNCAQTYTLQSHTCKPSRAIVDYYKRQVNDTLSLVVLQSSTLPLEATCGAAHMTQAPATPPGRIVSNTLDPCASMGHDKTE